jgi:tetratricopeptide (TPR) repeat protein
MTNEEAKKIYSDAIEQYKAGKFEGALSLLDELDRERPNSRNVLYYRALSFIRLSRLDEADECCKKLSGKLEADKLHELEASIASARSASLKVADDDIPDAIPVAEPIAEPAAAAPAAPTGDSANVYIIESSFPVGTDETTVTGHVKSGSFRTGDSVMLVSPEGMPTLAPILRIGTTETPLKMIREGQKSVMLLSIASNNVVVGYSATSEGQEESYAATMVADTGSNGLQADLVVNTPELMDAERRLRAKDYSGARGVLEGLIAGDSGNATAHWLIARAHIESEGEDRDPEKALEHVQQAYEGGGADDPRVVDTLAQAMGETGDAEHGLLFFERLHGSKTDLQARAALVKRIVAYRTKYNLGHVWEFADSYGDVIFEATGIDEIVTALSNETVARDSKCRRDRVDEWRTIEAVLVPEYPEIAALYNGGGGGNKKVLPIVIGVLVIAIVVVVLMNVL